MEDTALGRRTVVVVGATGAIGRATCAALLANGSRVYALGRHHITLLRLADDLGGISDCLHILPVNDNYQDLGIQLHQLFETSGSGIDVCIHAAGHLVPGAFLELSPREIEAIIDANFRSVVRTARAVIPSMVQHHAGHFIVVGSLGGIVPMPYQALYSSTKFALRGLCLSLHEELKRDGVTVSLVSPGPVVSSMLDDESTDPRAALTFSVAPVQPKAIADTIIQVLRSKKREAGLSAGHRYAALLANLFPVMFGKFSSLLTNLGQRRLVAYRRTLHTHEEHSYGTRSGTQTS